MEASKSQSLKHAHIQSTLSQCFMNTESVLVYDLWY